MPKYLPLRRHQIWILTSGSLPFNPAELLESKELGSLIEEFKHRFDIILFDSPPVLPVTDASLLAPKTQLESMGGKISGVILNHTQPQTEAIVPYPYYYKYKYRYYGKEESKSSPKSS